LAGKLGARGAARLQARLTRHAVNTVLSARLAPLQLWCAPRAHAFFAACRRDYPLTLHASRVPISGGVCNRRLPCLA